MISERRRAFAQEIRQLAKLHTAPLIEALATVSRERFLPPGPWTYRSERDVGGAAKISPDDDARHVYENVSIAIDPDRQLFNGQPALLTSCIDALTLRTGARVLHVGCGLGYYTALMAHVVGPRGRVLAVEVDEALAERARTNLRSTPWVEVWCADARGPLHERFDAVLVNAGVTHPEPTWLDALDSGGRLLLPLTATFPAMGPLGKGLMLLLTAPPGRSWLEARSLSFVAIYSAIGLRDETINQQLGQAMRARPFPGAARLRRDAHEVSAACWLHTASFCLDTA